MSLRCSRNFTRGRSHKEIRSRDWPCPWVDHPLQTPMRSQFWRSHFFTSQERFRSIKTRPQNSAHSPHTAAQRRILMHSTRRPLLRLSVANLCHFAVFAAGWRTLDLGFVGFVPEGLDWPPRRAHHPWCSTLDTITASATPPCRCYCPILVGFKRYAPVVHSNDFS